MYKELALIISEILIKQDETTGQVKDVAIQIKETNDIVNDFVSISIKQWDSSRFLTNG